MPPTSTMSSEETLWLVLFPFASNYYGDSRFIAGFITGFAVASVIFIKTSS